MRKWSCSVLWTHDLYTATAETQPHATTFIVWHFKVFAILLSRSDLKLNHEKYNNKKNHWDSAPNLGLFIESKHKQILHKSRCFLKLRLRWQNIRITVINSDFWHQLRREKSLPASMQDEAETPDLGTMGCDRVKGLEVLLNCDGKNCSPPRRRSKLIRATARGIFHAQIRLPGYQGDWTINTPTD